MSWVVLERSFTLRARGSCRKLCLILLLCRLFIDCTTVLLYTKRGPGLSLRTHYTLSRTRNTVV